MIIYGRRCLSISKHNATRRFILVLLVRIAFETLMFLTKVIDELNMKIIDFQNNQANIN
jgi:hypothetical protein